MNGAEQLTLMISALVGIALFCFMMYQIIHAASYGRKIWTEARKQTKLLEEMARKAGVDEAKLTEILNDFRYK